MLGTKLFNPKIVKDLVKGLLFNLLYLLLFKFNWIYFVSFNCSISSPSDWSRPDRSRPSKKMGPLLTAHLLVTMRYGPRQLVVTAGVKYMAWGLPTVAHILQPLCLKLCLLELIWRIFGIRCMNLTNQCRSSSRRRIGVAWSCMSDMRRRRRNRGSRFNPWSRGRCPCIATLSKHGLVVHHRVHNLHYLCLHLLCTTIETSRAFQILTTISIRSF